MNAEYIPIDNLSVYSNFKELIKNVTSTEAAKILSSKVASEISKQEVYNKRIDSLLNETCAFTKKVYQAIENEPEVKKVLQTLGSGAQLSGRQNIPEGAYEYNKLFIECGIKAYVNSDITQKSYEEKYESLEILSKALNVLFEGYSLYEVSNKIEDQYIELTWCCNFLNANPAMLKAFFSVKEKIKVFDVRKKSIVEKNNKNKEVYSMLDNRQKILLFMAAEDMVVNGLNSTFTIHMSEQLFQRSTRRRMSRVAADCSARSSRLCQRISYHCAKQLWLRRCFVNQSSCIISIHSRGLTSQPQRR